MAQQFRFEDLFKEIKSAEETMDPFLQPTATEVFADLRRQLETIRSRPFGEKARWEIAKTRPLFTRLSEGLYEPKGRKGKHKVIGEITSVWEIMPSDPKANNRTLARTFALCGLTSVRVRLLEGSTSGQVLGEWRMEIASDGAPGCFFHIQVLGEDGRNVPPFPHSLSIPRLPSLAFTPMTALEFVVGELFQESWREHAVQETNAMNFWRSIQEKRLMALLDWYQQVIKSTGGSPWNALKAAVPQEGLFL